MVLATAAACALIVHAGLLNDLVNRSDTVETVDSVASTIERTLSSDTGTVAAVSDERLSRFLYDRGVRGPVFHVPPLGEDRFFDLDGLDQIDRVVWVDVGSVGDARPGELVVTHGSVSIRTEVHR
ncbi:MAG: hypothetical protein KJN63_10675 [Acidimicrobiia bacterium]|nr:hypothetical protein [Acidimicrobiia bacterium]